MVRRLLVFAMAALLASCGFHLRGFNDMPKWLSNVAIVVESAHRDLGPMLKDQLAAYKIALSPDSTRADYLLIIQSDGIQQQITNIAASTAPRQYLLTYALQFKLVKNKGAEIIPSTLVSVTRQLTINNDRILGSNSEEAQMITEMHRDAVMQIMNRLGS